MEIKDAIADPIDNHIIYIDNASPYISSNQIMRSYNIQTYPTPLIYQSGIMWCYNFLYSDLYYCCLSIFCNKHFCNKFLLIICIGLVCVLLLAIITNKIN